MGFRNVVARAHAGMLPPQFRLLERSFGLIDSKALTVVAELGIADQLEHGPQTAEELARAVGANSDALDRLLAYMVAAGFLGRSGRGRYRNNAASNRLRRNHPQSVRDWIIFSGADWSGMCGTIWDTRFEPVRAAWSRLTRCPFLST